MVDVEFLTSVPIFASLKEEQLQSLPGKLQPRSYQRGEVIFHEDDPADRMHIIARAGGRFPSPPTPGGNGT